MGAKLSIIENNVIATFDGTNTARFWRDPSLRKAVQEAINAAREDMDIFELSNFIFSYVNNAVRRRYGGQELQLESVTVKSSGRDMEVVSTR